MQGDQIPLKKKKVGVPKSGFWEVIKGTEDSSLRRVSNDWLWGNPAAGRQMTVSPAGILATSSWEIWIGATQLSPSQLAVPQKPSDIHFSCQVLEWFSCSNRWLTAGIRQKPGVPGHPALTSSKFQGLWIPWNWKKNKTCVYYAWVFLLASIQSFHPFLRGDFNLWKAPSLFLFRGNRAVGPRER